MADKTPKNNLRQPTDLVGGVSIGLGPPRSLTSLKQCHFNSEIIIRDFHLMDYAFGKSIFEGQWKARTALTAITPATFNVLDRFTHSTRFTQYDLLTNQTNYVTRQQFSDGGPGLNNVDRKIMWKIYDRKRDYNWVYDITAADPDSAAAQSRDTASQT